MDLVFILVGLGVSALLHTVTSLSPFPLKCFIGWIAEGANAECLALA